ncbi:MAG: SpoIIE family protein phosphatase [Candidatus Rifleibacteriota bacterium]
MRTESGRKTFQNGLVWLLILFFPAMVFSYLWNLYSKYLFKNNLENEVQRVQSECENIKITAADSENYLSSNLRDIYYGNVFDPGKMEIAVQNFLNKTDLNCRIMIWNSKAEITYCNFNWTSDRHAWEKAARTMILEFTDQYDIRFEDYPEDEIINLRTMIGPIFFTQSRFICSHNSSPSLARVSFSDKADKIWLGMAESSGLLVFFNPDKLKNYSSIKNHITQINQEKNRKNPIFLLEGSSIMPETRDHSASLKAFSGISKIKTNRVLTRNDLTLCVYPLDDSRKLIGLIDHHKIPGSTRVIHEKVFLLFWFFIATLLAQHFAASGKKPAPGRLQLRLIVLFVFSSFLPMLFYLVIGHDYVNEFRESRIGDLNRSSLDFLQSIDEGVVFSESAQLATLEKTIPALENSLQKEGITRQAVSDFISKQVPELRNFFLIGSQTPLIANERAILTRNQVINYLFQSDQGPIEPDRINRVRAFDIIFKFFLTLMNGSTPSDKQGLEAEMVFDAMGQSNQMIISQSYFESLGTLWRFGFGSQPFKSFIKILRLNSSAYDYNLLAILSSGDLARHFAEKTINNLNRNKYGFRIFIRTSYDAYFPEGTINDYQIRVFLDKINASNNGISSVIDYQGKKHFFMPYQGNHNDNISMVAIFPLEVIDDESKKLIKNILLAGILTALAIFALSLLISGTVTEPITVLKKGVNALGSRNFSYRLPDLGKNEFGHLAQIFNRTLNDMEELQVAGIVQEKLLPQLNEEQVHGKINFYGKTESLDDLGGDYFDILNSSDGKTGFMLGDVSGHGVAASLIMAFVKSAVIKLFDLYNQPLALANRLNKLLKQTQNRNQKKFMSFQYLLFDKNGQFTYLNAGHCFPILIDKNNNRVEMLAMINSPLGTSKKDYEKTASYQLEPGQALVLYTDGYYELENMDLEKFKSALLSSFNISPLKYFQNVNQFYQKAGLIQNSDDKTLVIITCSTD